MWPAISGFNDFGHLNCITDVIVYSFMLRSNISEKETRKTSQECSLPYRSEYPGAADAGDRRDGLAYIRGRDLRKVSANRKK